MFGDNLAVVNSATIPSGKLQKRQNILNYHRVREAQAAGIINFVHMDGKDNPADICSKDTSSKEWYEVMKPLYFGEHEKIKWLAIVRRGVTDCQVHKSTYIR